MLDFKTQSQLVDAAATIMRSYLTAATNTMAASASRSFTLWRDLLDAAEHPQAPTGEPQTTPRFGPFSWPLAAGWPALPGAANSWSAWPWTAGDPSGLSAPGLARSWWLGPSVTFWAPLADWSAWGRGPLPAWAGGWLLQPPPSSRRAAPAGRPKTAADEGFAAYRSAGGHAVAQVVVGKVPDRSSGRAEPPKRP